MSPVDFGGIDAAALAHTIEPLAVAAWPARATEQRDGWILRFTDGFSHRGNSVATFAALPGDVEAELVAVERAYAARRLRPMFHLTPITRPEHLDTKLLARGYRAVSPTHVCVATVPIVRARLSGADGAIACDRTDPRFGGLVTAGSRSQADGRERLDVLVRLELPHVCMLVEEAGVAIACGVGVRTADWVSVYVMRTHAAHRRRGHARRVVAGIVRWAEEQGATRLFLQVEDGNAGARALYAGAGFVPAYPYRFFVRG